MSFKVLVLCSLLFYFIPSINTLDTIVPGQSVKDNETLVSSDGSFEAGFFNLGDPNSQYFGIWYKDISPRTVAWIANRDSPLGNSSGVFNVTDGGNLVILNSTKGLVWSSNTSTMAKKPVVQLLENGNLVMREESNPGNFLWQSFDLPGDTLLPGMKIRSSLKSGNYTSLVCWKDTKNPARGEYSYHIDTRGYPQVVLSNGEKLFLRTGSWNGKTFSGIPSETLHKLLKLSFVITDHEVSYEYELMNKSIISRYMVTSIGQVQRFMLSDQTKSWKLFFVGPADQCDNYALCGANSNCDANVSPPCQCLPGFIPKYQEDWSSLKWSGGCVLRVNLDCGLSDGFMKYTRMKLPDTSASWFDKSMNLEECEKFCLKNCSCVAYASLDIRDGGSGCLLWFNKIMDMRIMNAGGQDLYIRVAASELVTDHNKGLNKKQLAGVLVGCSMFIVVMIILGVALLWRKKLKNPGKNQIFGWKNHPNNKENEGIDIPIFDLSTIANATNNFSICNKLGEGGFGPVHKGTLTNGQDIAVKRLSNNTGQGPEEFINEVLLIANLQHRNLVKLLGCCIQNDERILIYEFLINRSLDYFIFDQTKKKLLLWAERFQIICGIARGLLYLHEDSRLRIIHRDLKASNILLDENMNPKISDFGLARTFGGDEAEEKTKRVAGTYGYMSPEYASHGYFSVKSDVFSFGVILLEIVSGKKNMEYFHHHNLHLLGHAWKLWCKNTPLELIDESLGDSVPSVVQEVSRCIHTGLLCVQEGPEDRPDMSAVVLMLNGEKPLPRPNEPPFYPRHLGSSSENSKLHSTNEISMSLLKPR